MAIVKSSRYEFDNSVFKQDGAFYDLGCYRWEWNQPFIGRRPIIGVDPIEDFEPLGCTLYRAVIAPYAGNLMLHGAGLNAALSDGQNGYEIPLAYDFHRPERQISSDYLVPAVTWKKLVAQHGKPALVKMNIEGAEIPILMTEQHPLAPQLIIAFHYREMDCSQPNWPPETSVHSCLLHLAQWYDITQTELRHTGDDRWFICLAR